MQMAVFCDTASVSDFDGLSGAVGASLQLPSLWSHIPYIIYVNTRVHIYIYIYTYVYVCVCLFIYLLIFMYMYIYI